MNPVKISIADLMAILANLKNTLPETADRDFLLYGLGTEFLRLLMGNEWVNQNVFPFEDISSRQVNVRREFLRTESIDHSDRFKHQDRVVHLAELLFNLRLVPGFSQKLVALQTAELESLYSELEAAGLLIRSGIDFYFVVPTGELGEDYDVEIISSTTTHIPVELKTKVEDTKLSKNTLLSSLGSARKQMPSDRQGIVFVKIPEDWIRDQGIANIVKNALDEFFRNTSRVIAVVFRWEEWYSNEEGQRMRITKFRVERNEAQIKNNSPIMEVLESLEDTEVVDWLYFPSLVSPFL
jgi:hypothetical protein